MMRRLLLGLVLVVLFVCAGAGFYLMRLNARVNEPFKGYAGEEIFVDIPNGSGGAEIRRRLVSNGVVSDDLTFRVALMFSGHERGLKAGEYRFERPMSAADVIGVLARGDVYRHPITFPEGLTIREMSAIYESRGLGPASDFVAAARDGSIIHDLDPKADDLEGYLFPETYALTRGTPATALVKMMVDRFRQTLRELQAKHPVEKLPLRDLVTLASLVEKETAKAEERPLVSAVYHNRLDARMPMQADPTVVYALTKAGTYDGNIRKRDLSYDSPYNTYRYPGLPPGPIAAPGRAALEAALTPADVPYLYFVSRNDGSHVFADSLAKHNANVYEYQVEYFRKQRAAARSQSRD